MAGRHSLTAAQYWHTLCGRSANERYCHTRVRRRDGSCARIHTLARASEEILKPAILQGASGGETRTRTGDTTISAAAPRQSNVVDLQRNRERASRRGV